MRRTETKEIDKVLAGTKNVTGVLAKVLDKPKTEYKMLSTKNLVTGTAYQRDIDNKRVSKIVAEYDEHKFGIIRTSFRDGVYYVFDGQHRLKVKKVVENGLDSFVMCEVHHGLTYEDEARLFAEQYQNAIKVNADQMMQALIECKDPDTMTMIAIIESLGFTLYCAKGCAVQNRILATAALRKMYSMLGAKDFEAAMRLLKLTWDGKVGSLEKYVLDGMSVFYKVYKADIKSATFITQLGKIEPTEIRRIGKTDLSVTGAMQFAKVFLQQYNKNRNKANRLEYKFKC